MNSVKIDHNTNGTPSDSTRDASRLSENPLSSVFHNAHLHDDASEKLSHFSSCPSSVIEPGDTVEINSKEKPTDHSTTDTPPTRPKLIYRQSTHVSIAAAPYGAVFCSDLGRSATVDNKELRRHDLSRASTRQHPRSSSSSSTLNQLPSGLALASQVSTDAYGNVYPEGGFQAWLCVLGSFCGLMSALGLMNTIGTYQAYISTHQLQSQSDSAIGWIFGVYAFLAFFCGIQIGPIFDAKGPRWLVLAGSILLMATYLLLGVCTAYWHFLVVFGIVGGIGTSLVFTPAIAAIGHHFLRKRGQCTGLATVGGSLGGIVYPLTLQALFPRIGFAWSTRVLALINLVLLIVANLTIKSRLPPVKATLKSITPDLRIFADPLFTLTTLGTFAVEWGLFIPLSYLTSYAIAHDIPTGLAYQLIAILNTGSCLGRYFPGLIADRVGRFNALVLTIALCFLSVWALWFPSNTHPTPSLIIIFALVFGFASGSGISLTPVCVGQLCRVENYGRYYATCYTVASFACLTGIPIAGRLVRVCGGDYWGLIVFTGCAYAVSTGMFVAARVLGVGWGWKKF